MNPDCLFLSVDLNQASILKFAQGYLDLDLGFEVRQFTRQIDVLCGVFKEFDGDTLTFELARQRVGKMCAEPTVWI